MATSTVETLLVELDSNTAKLREEIRKAEQNVSNAERKIGRSTRSVDNAFTRVGRSAGAMGKRVAAATKSMFSLRNVMIGIGSISAAAVAIERTVNSVNTLAKAANTANQSAENVQELQFAFGQLADVTDNDVNMGLQRFSRRLGLAVDGTGAAADTFGELGIAIQDADGKIRDTETVLDETLRALAGIEDGAYRAAKASEIFGEDAGPRLASALDGGIENMNEARKRAHELGLVLNEELVQGSEEAADKIDILKRRIGKDFQTLVLTNAEDIVTLTEAFTTFASWVASASAEVVNFTKWISESLAAAINGISADDLPRLNARLKEIEDMLDEAENGRLQINDRRQKALEEEVDTIRTLIKLERERRENSRPDEVTVAPANIEGGGGGSGGSSTTAGRSGVPAMSAGPREAGDLTMDQMEILYRRAQRASKEANESMQKDARDTEDALSGVTDEQERMEELSQSLGFTFSSAFEDAIVEGGKLREVLQGMAKDVQRIIIRKTTTEPLANAIGGALSGWLGGTSTSSSTGGVGDNITPIQGGTASSSMGNVFTGPSMTSIAETGQPEAVLPLERENGKLGVRMSGGGGRGNVAYVDARGADQATVMRLKQAFEELDMHFEERSVAAVVDDTSRGGAMRGAMG